MNRLLSSLSFGLVLMTPLTSHALEPGDVMVVGYQSSGTDAVSFVTWVELAAGESITILDAEYSAATGTYDSPSTMVWTNDTGSPVAPGTVIVVTDTATPSANIGSASGNLGLTNQGEQFFLIRGTISGGNLVGDLLFGVDYDASSGSGWDGGGESDLPSGLGTNHLFLDGETSNEFTSSRTGQDLATFKNQVLNLSNWGSLAGASLDSTSFQPNSSAPDYLPGDLMFVGWNTTSPDSLSFVTWVDIPNGESFLFIDAEYDGGGDGSGKGIGGGSYASPNTMTWTNTEGVDLPAGTVVVVTDMANGSSTANVGTTTGGFALTNQGEQMFIAQGSLLNSGGNDYFEGDLIFGVDFEGDVGWGEAGESELPGTLNVPGGNLSFGDQPALEYSGTRNGLPVEDYPVLVLNAANWQALSSSPSGESFVETVIPPVVVPDELGQVNEGLLFHARRMNGGQPILDETWSLAQGASSGNSDNLNGAFCIRLPDDLPTGQRVHPSAKYYLYFADHAGTYIRMAWAADLEGSWTGYRMDQGIYSSGDRGVLDLGSDGEIDLGGSSVQDHIASPQVLIERDDSDPQNPAFQFVMFYHGRRDDPNNGPQRTFVATSSDGLNFNQPSGGDSRPGQSGHGTRDFSHGDSYFRVFNEGGRYYAFSNTGDLFAVDENSPADLLSPSWSKGPQPFITETESRGWVGWSDPPGSQTIGDLRPRHFGVLKRNGILYAFLTNKAASPEQIQVSTFNFADLPSGTNDSWRDWKGAFPSQELIAPEENWEGGDLPIDISRLGSATGVRQLRDPGILEDLDGRTYLFYSGRGEEAIGVAQLVSRPVVRELNGVTEVTTGADHTFSVTTDVDVSASMRRISKTTPIALSFGAEDSEPEELVYAGNGLAHEQTDTVNAGAKSYRLAHDSSGQSTTLTFPDTYYARPGTTLAFNSRMGNSSTGQFAEVQISFDGTTWQTLWIQQGGTEESIFTKVNVGMDDVKGRIFQLRFRYIHETVRNPSYESGTSSNRGWFFDQIVATGLETVTNIHESAFTAGSFTLAEITPILDPHLTVEAGGEEDRFLIQVAGLHSGTGFSEAIGYGKPYVVRVRDSYEDFLAENFIPDGNGQYPADSGEHEDPDGDGFVNLVEHGFGTDPNVANVQPVRIANTPGIGPDPTIAFSWNPNSAYGYELQMSTTLNGDFVPIPFVETLTPNGDLVDVELKPDPSLYPLGDKAFFRLSIPSP
ncbi:hypothetical protein [Haloferula rosea]|uniref:Uncharacterized protein n=1 Tax=Haloferula rosea TaxID=490093 RepID=A0A934VF61_9BACT|nr:hypothetical protein [Haloferula rosea]MBK1826741.1 hypothetical protein [Haloferula rosea]